MKRTVIFLGCIFCVGFVSAIEPVDKKSDIINELIEVTNALDFATSMGDMVASNIVQQSGMSPEISTIILKETKQIIREELIENGFVQNLMQDLYKKHFTLEELKQLVTFYQSDTGKKALSVLPGLSQEAMTVTQERMTLINPKLQKRLIKVLQNQ